MNHSFFSKIKEVSIKDIGHIFLFLIALLPGWIYGRLRPNLWLFCENEYEARDNGYWLFEYVRKNHPECDAVYAINPKSKDAKKVQAIGPQISYGTLKHWVYYLAARVNISSQKAGKPNAAVCYFLEVYGFRKNTRVFLQHGIIKDDLPFVHYENAKFSMFVTSTKREYDYVKGAFHYPGDEVKLLGLCRFDHLWDAKTKDNQILVMPTWRSWISPPSNGKSQYHGIESIRGSEYYQKWNAFLESDELSDFLQKHDLELVFYQHREMQKFQGLFESRNKRIVIAGDLSYDVQELLKESRYLITDYSSIAMDFAYMDKPLCYYQFDYKQFRDQHYQEGYFTYEEDGFGRICYDENSLMNALREMVEEPNQYDREYAKRRETFFTLKDNENCKRNYEAIKKLLEEE